MFCCLFATFVPAEIAVAACEVDILFVEYCCPLERRTVQNLASRTMAKLSSERPLSAKLILHFPAMTASLVKRFEVGIVVVDFVRGAEFPLVVLAADVFVAVAVGFGLLFFGLRGGHFGGCGTYEGPNGGDIGTLRDVESVGDERVRVRVCY